METFQTKEQIFFAKNGKPKSVLLDYKVYAEMLELIEDAKCIKVVQNRENEPTLSESEFKKKLKLT